MFLNILFFSYVCLFVPGVYVIKTIIIEAAFLVLTVYLSVLCSSVCRSVMYLC